MRLLLIIRPLAVVGFFAPPGSRVGRWVNRSIKHHAAKLSDRQLWRMVHPLWRSIL